MIDSFLCWVHLICILEYFCLLPMEASIFPGLGRPGKIIASIGGGKYNKLIVFQSKRLIYKDTGEPKGECTVTFNDHLDAQCAIRWFHSQLTFCWLLKFYKVLLKSLKQINYVEIYQYNYFLQILQSVIKKFEANKLFGNLSIQLLFCKFYKVFEWSHFISNFEAKINYVQI